MSCCVCGVYCCCCCCCLLLLLFTARVVLFPRCDGYAARLALFHVVFVQHVLFSCLYNTSCFRVVMIVQQRDQPERYTGYIYIVSGYSSHRGTLDIYIYNTTVLSTGMEHNTHKGFLSWSTFLNTDVGKLRKKRLRLSPF